MVSKHLRKCFFRKTSLKPGAARLHPWEKALKSNPLIHHLSAPPLHPGTSNSGCINTEEINSEEVQQQRSSAGCNLQPIYDE